MSGLSRYPTVVDEVTVRLVACLVLLLGTAALATRSWVLYAALALDFVLRAVLGPRWSPLAQLVLRGIRPLVPARPRPTAGPPKRFAASIGAVLTAVAAGCAFASAAAAAADPAPIATTVVTTVGVLMVVFPLLEAAIGLCVGCLLFARLITWGIISESQCLECLDITRRRPAHSQV